MDHSHRPRQQQQHHAGAFVGTRNIDKENNTSHLIKKSAVSNDLVAESRPILSSKSSNGLSVNKINNNTIKLKTKPAVSNPFNSIKYDQAYEGKQQQEQTQQQNISSLISGNANKARKITQRRSFFFDNNIENHNEKIHDSTTLLRSQSHSQGDNFLFSRNNNLTNFKEKDKKTIRKIKSQLTFSEDNDMAEFFKKSKFEENKQLGILNTEKDQHSDSIQETNIKHSEEPIVEFREDEITMADESTDITSMHRIALERDSPVYHRTRKVNMATLLSSSNDSFDQENNTFDFKVSDKNNYEHDNLEDLINKTLNKNMGKHLIDDDVTDIEAKSQNTNGVYDDTIPDIEEYNYQNMTPGILAGLWNEDEHHSGNISDFEDPLKLHKNWLSNKKLKTKSLDLSAAELIQISESELELEFSEEEEDEEKGIRNGEISKDDENIEFDIDDEEEGQSLNKIMEFYQ